MNKHTRMGDMDGVREKYKKRGIEGVDRRERRARTEQTCCRWTLLCSKTRYCPRPVTRLNLEASKRLNPF